MSDWLVIAACVTVALAALQDLATLRIYNLWSLALILLFGAWAWTSVGLDSALLHNLTFALAIFALGALLFWLGWFGGGDVKLMAACALWFDWTAGSIYLIAVLLGGGVLSLMLIFGRRLAAAFISQEISWPALKPRGPIPYGVAIAAGAILSLSIGGPRPVHDVFDGLATSLPSASAGASAH